MDKETAQYTVTYFSSLLTDKEKLAIKHTHSLMKFDCDQDRVTEHPRYNIYRKIGWLTEDESILELLKDGYDNFQLKTAQRILTQNPNEIFLNYCLNCNRLARTPYAKQCRHCGHDWHE